MTPLDANAYLQPNVEAHRRKWNVAPSWPAVAACDDGMWAGLHGTDPIAEASAWLDRATSDRAIPDTVCVIGAGLGFIVDAVVERSKSRVLVLETEPALLPWFFGRRDWRPVIDEGRLAVLAGPGFEGAQIAWRLFGNGEASPLVLAHPVLGKSRPDVTRLAAQLIGRARQGARGNEEARRKFAAPYLVNTLGNTAIIAAAGSVDDLVGQYRGTPIVVAAAGPSLNRNLEELRPYRDRVVLLAVDTALKPVLASGMAPDFVVALDPSDANARHLTDIVVPESTALVAEPSIAPSSFRAFGGRVFAFRVAEHAPWPWLRRMGIDCGTLRAWGSVVTSTFDLALRMGGDPLVFIGTDLAYTNGQPYARGTTYEEDWLVTAGPDRTIEWVWQQTIAQKGIPGKDINGHDTTTGKGLAIFRDWLVEESKRPGMPRLVNATGAGILSGGQFQQATLDRVLASSNPRTPATSSVRAVKSHADSDSATASDRHILQVLLNPRPVPTPTVSEAVPPYRQRPRWIKKAATKALRAERATDVERWRDPANFEVSWHQVAEHAARLVPPGSRVLDLGAGLETLARFLPADCCYTPSDVVSLSSRTVVADLNREEFPDGEFDVIAALLLLEFIHDVPRLLTEMRRRAPLAIVTYCVRTAEDLEARLERGFVSDFTRNELVLLCQKTGWQVVFAERLSVGPGFEPWTFALTAQP